MTVHKKTERIGKDGFHKLPAVVLLLVQPDQLAMRLIVSPLLDLQPIRMNLMVTFTLIISGRLF